MLDAFSKLYATFKELTCSPFDSVAFSGDFSFPAKGDNTSAHPLCQGLVKVSSQSAPFFLAKTSVSLAPNSKQAQKAPNGATEVSTLQPNHQGPTDVLLQQNPQKDP
jgi:hypothetical protein